MHSYLSPLGYIVECSTCGHISPPMVNNAKRGKGQCEAINRPPSKKFLQGLWTGTTESHIPCLRDTIKVWNAFSSVLCSDTLLSASSNFVTFHLLSTLAPTSPLTASDLVALSPVFPLCTFLPCDYSHQVQVYFSRAKATTIFRNKGPFRKDGCLIGPTHILVHTRRAN